MSSSVIKSSSIANPKASELRKGTEKSKKPKKKWGSTPEKEPSADPKQALQEALNANDINSFVRANRSRLVQRNQSNTNDNAFHFMARWTPDGDDEWSEKQKLLFDSLLNDTPALLEQANTDEKTPMHVALEKHSEDFIKKVLGSAPEDNIMTILDRTSLKGNCVHLAVEYGYPEFDLLLEKCRKNQPILEAQTPTKLTNTATKAGGDTPLHIVVKKLALNDEDQEAKELRRVLQEFDGVTSRLRAASYRGREPNQSLLRRQTTIHEDESPPTLLAMTKLLVEACPSALGIKNAQGRTPYQEREHTLKLPAMTDFISKYDKEQDEIQRNLSQENVPQEGKVQENGESNTLKRQGIKRQEGKVAVDAYQMSKNKKIKAEERTRMIFVEDPIANCIRSHCIRSSTSSREERLTRLYQPGQERHIEFDIMGFPRPTVSLSYLDQLTGHVKFESILKYVALPNLTLEGPSRASTSNDTVASTRGGRSDLVAIFKWLWANGVREIIKVVVVDDKDPPHADTAIIEALKGFKVEQWDWRKIDLCSDVVSKSSRSVRQLSLYASGNSAVFMGWASAEGLGNRDKFPDLETINLVVRQGLEDPKTLNDNIRELEESIRYHASRHSSEMNGGARDDISPAEQLSIKVNLVSNTTTFSSANLNGPGYNVTTPMWIKSIADFAGFLRESVKTKLNEDREKTDSLKIAIIDDGIDATVSGLQQQIANGATFYPYAPASELMNPYFVPSGMHGTVMAQMICRICPNVQLYIARLEELPSLAGGGRRITPKSATQAVEWATNCKVDIISMSWTIQTDQPEENPDMMALRKAVHNAEQKDILLFCSTSDQGHNTDGSNYPAKWIAGSCIGAATFEGDQLSWVEKKVDFCFPGRDVPFQNSDDNTTTLESGSSVATAAATGLAGALIYSCRLLGGKYNKYFPNQTAIGQAFKRMSASGSDVAFPRTEDTFGKRFIGKLTANGIGTKKPDISNLDWDTTSRKALEDLINYIKGN
ncbi:hypothetical protein EV356DRAFT_577549 [Viridothelium virens]|uniref:Peptidase S8/S53 domain-containing protein n=1 Tax=Viridothelium virens TaxID=1048519 RepID=A0A6A6H609_VIRVR|nr:hypothetical protein EV356DRAFT_577549 [Viridothelium virens]